MAPRKKATTGGEKGRGKGKSADESAEDPPPAEEQDAPSEERGEEKAETGGEPPAEEEDKSGNDEDTEMAETVEDPPPAEEQGISSEDKGKRKAGSVEDTGSPQDPAGPPNEPGSGGDGPSESIGTQPTKGSHFARDTPKGLLSRGFSEKGIAGGSPLDVGKADFDSGIHVIVLGPSGGPREDRVTSFLVRSLATKWAPNSVVAVDAGTLLSPINDILDGCASANGTGPGTNQAFAGLRLPFKSSGANSAHIFKRVIGKILLTHAHLDHVSGLLINTPSLEKDYSPKTVAALPSVVDALQTHVFNDVIWPNLTDENGGVGLITFQRLKDGRNPTIDHGNDSQEGYVQACDGLLTQCFSLSHGRCRSTTRGQSNQSDPGVSQPTSAAGDSQNPTWVTVESSAYFLRDQKTQTEILIFGDVEPDTISNKGLNERVWTEAARKVAFGHLRAIFIECSYSDATEDMCLFGHLCPRHLCNELIKLADLVVEASAAKKKKLPAQMKRDLEDISDVPPVERPAKTRTRSACTNKSPTDRGMPRVPFSPDQIKTLSESSSAPSSDTPGLSAPTGLLSIEHKGIANSPNMAMNVPGTQKPLEGLTVYVIHVKESMTDGPDPREKILAELRDLGHMLGLGCEFRIPKRGESIYV